MNNFLKSRKNTTNRNFFAKFQEQVSQAPGFKPMLSQDDFLKLVAAAQEAEKTKENLQVQLPPLEISK